MKWFISSDPIELEQWAISDIYKFKMKKMHNFDQMTIKI